MSFLMRQLPKQLMMWVLGKSINSTVDISPLIRLGMLGLTTLVIGALLAVITFVGLLAALYQCLITDLALSPAASLLIISAVCAVLSASAFYCLKTTIDSLHQAGTIKIKNFFSDPFANIEFPQLNSELVHTSKDIIKNFAEGFMRR
ncbi:MAG: hypothetical protein EB059_03820 [Alphaproteobacteria bacterium]|nr:hypothetical protein [Alphaproteobacteria bacterium]